MKYGGLLALSIGLVLVLIARILWKKGNSDEPLRQSLLEAIVDVVTLQFFSTFRSSALVLYFIGLIIILLSVLYLAGILTIDILITHDN